MDSLIDSIAGSDLRYHLTMEVETFIEDNRGALYRIAASYEADADRLQDLLQEIVLAVWSASKKFRGESSFRTFAFRVAHNRAMTFVASEQRRNAREVMDGGAEVVVVDAPDRKLARDQLLDQVRSLPLPLRQVLTLALEGLSYDEIAQVLDITRNNAGVRLNRARSQLKEMWDA